MAVPAENSRSRSTAENAARDIVPPATTSLSPRGGAKHRTMKKSILRLLKKSGEQGRAIPDLAQELAVLKSRVQAWFDRTGKHSPEIQKIGVARWKYAGNKSDLPPKTHSGDSRRTRRGRNTRNQPIIMKLETLKDLYIHELKDLYSAEKQIIKALPKMVKAATNKKLASGFAEHLKQTKVHAERLEKILAGLDETTRGPKCKGMEGVLKEGAEMIEEDAEPEVRDAGLIAAGQRVEHYEMAGYGTARTYAQLIGDKTGARLLQTTLDEEARTDEKLTKLAQTTINVEANK